MTNSTNVTTTTADENTNCVFESATSHLTKADCPDYGCSECPFTGGKNCPNTINDLYETLHIQALAHH